MISTFNTIKIQNGISEKMVTIFIWDLSESTPISTKEELSLNGTHGTSVVKYKI